MAASSLGGGPGHWMPSGLDTVSSPPAPSGPGANAIPIHKPASSAAAAQAMIRQRGDTSRPSGNSNNKNVTVRANATSNGHWLSHAMASPPGSEPGRWTNEYQA